LSILDYSFTLLSAGTERQIPRTSREAHRGWLAVEHNKPEVKETLQKLYDSQQLFTSVRPAPWGVILIKVKAIFVTGRGDP
jgi:hypothetical protein